MAVSVSVSRVVPMALLRGNVEMSLKKRNGRVKKNKLAKIIKEDIKICKKGRDARENNASST